MLYDLHLLIYRKIFGVKPPKLDEIYENKIDGFKYRIVSNTHRGYILKNKSTGKRCTVHQVYIMRAKKNGILKKV